MFLLFYEWHGISRREVNANSMKQAWQIAKELIDKIEPKDDPIKWAYIVKLTAGKRVR